MTNLTRRGFGRALLAAPMAAAVLPTAAAARPAAGLTTPPAVAVRRVGRFTVAALSDGWFDPPFGLFTGAPAEDIAARAAAVNAAGENGLRIGFTVWLIDDGERLVLVDAGTGGAIAPTNGRLDAALAAVGVTRADIDAVVLTHMHVDHIGGLVAGGARTFPNADVIVDGREIAFFTDAAAAAAAPEIARSSFAAAADVARLYPVERVSPGFAVARGVETVDLSGHTPGHMGVRIGDGDDSLTLAGDMLFHPALHPATTDLGIAFEADPAGARAMRERFFPAAAEQGTLVAATHMPFPGLGRIVRDGASFGWAPADWTYGA